MDAGACVSDVVSATSFNLYSADEVRKLSVCRIDVPVAFDALGHAVHGGLYDPSLGPVDRGMRCPTCNLSSDHCPGHCGHVELVVPVYNPLVFPVMFNLLRRKCFNCHKFKMAAFRTRVYATKLALLDVGELTAALNLDQELQGDASAGAKPKEDGKEALADEIARQTGVLDKYDALCKEQPKKQGRGVHVREARARIIKKFLAAVPTKACANCQAVSVGLRKDGCVKIFQKPLSKKARATMKTKGLSFESALKARPEDGNEWEAAASSSDDDDDDDGDDDMGQESKANGEEGNRAKFMPASEVEMQMKALWEAEPAITKAIWGRKAGLYSQQTRTPAGWEQFFLRVLLVPPTRFRPPAILGADSFEHAQNHFYAKVLNLNDQLTAAGVGKDGVAMDLTKVISVWIELQDTVNALMDSSKASTLDAQQANNGIRQLLEKKEGLFRKNMMGKRVNFAARSVISPDPFISTDEIGVPLRFAKKLTFVVPVTSYNVEHLRRLVINGADVHPGANFVQDEQGRLTDLSKRSLEQRQSIAKTLMTPSASGGSFACKKVWRHLHNGDMVLMNRQPTLHKPSIMAHTARVLRSKTEQPIRMHYANCKTYNADFDGDEMNMHFPQDLLAQAEARTIAATSYQYLVPTTGSPIRGLIQDHIDMAVLLTKRDTFLDKDTYQQLVYSAVTSLPRFQANPSTHIKLLPPTVLKPTPLWTGKQVVSTLLHALTGDLPAPACYMDMDGRAGVGAAMWGTPAQEPGDHLILVRGNELLLGVLDKKSIGNTEYGLVHNVYELYGPSYAGALLSAFGKLLTVYLQQMGVTCGLEDLVLKPDADAARKELIKAAYDAGSAAAAKFCGLDDTMPSTVEEVAAWTKSIRAHLQAKIMRAVASDGASAAVEAGVALDNAMKAALAPNHSTIIDRCLKSGLRRVFPRNFFSLMISTGAKGSPVNHAMIVGGLGQQELEGRRVPIMASGKSLPCFPAFHPAPRAGGYIADRFLTGLRPQEYYFHCMSGREGLVDTAVKTSRSGYLQRCLIKHLEELSVHYDYSVRDSEGNIVQFLYGEDGVDVMHGSYLKADDDQLSFLARNYHALSHKYALGEVASDLDFDAAFEHHSVVQGARKATTDGPYLPKVGDPVSVRQRLPGVKAWEPAGLSQVWLPGLVTKVKGVKRGVIRDGAYVDVELENGAKARKVPLQGAHAVKVRVPDPLTATMSMASSVGVVSETFQDKLESYIERNPKGLLTQGEEEDGMEGGAGVLSAEAFNVLMWMKSMRSVVEPGEPVGVLAGQSVGEPSTQMTLNTFHLAGHGGVNVTLGIPRLREIVMTASSNIKTPAMTLPLLPALQDKRHIAASAARQLSRLKLGELLDSTRSDGGIRVVDELVPEIPTQADHPAATWVRQYRIRLHFVNPAWILDAFGVSMQALAASVGKTFARHLFTAIAKVLRRTGEKLGAAATATPKGDDDDVAPMAARVVGAVQVDQDDNEQPSDMSDSDSGSDSEAELEARLAELEEAREVAAAAKKGVASGGEEEEEEDSDTSASDGGEGAGVAPKPADKADVSAAEVPASISKNPLFGGCRFSTTEAWVELVTVFPASARKVLMISLVEKAVSAALVRQTKGITRCVVATPDNQLCVQSEGVNFPAAWALGDVFDVNRIASNDIAAILRHMGVEAARQAITREIRGVFKVYGIKVDPRHLGLIADYMTYSGGYRAMNRLGMDASSSPFLQMSFETTARFLTQACLRGNTDAADSSSARIVLGRVVSSGTGAFDLMHPLPGME